MPKLFVPLVVGKHNRTVYGFHRNKPKVIFRRGTFESPRIVSSKEIENEIFSRFPTFGVKPVSSRLKRIGTSSYSSNEPIIDGYDKFGFPVEIKTYDEGRTSSTAYRSGGRSSRVYATFLSSPEQMNHLKRHEGYLILVDYKPRKYKGSSNYYYSWNMVDVKSVVPIMVEKHYP